MANQNGFEKYIIVGISSIIIILGIVLLFRHVEGSYISSSKESKISKEKQLELIKSDLNVDLPDSSKIINFSFYKDSDSFEAKIYIDEQNINEIRKKLNNYFGGEITKPYDLWHFENTCSWWDLKKEYIKVPYSKDMAGGYNSEGDPAFTRNVWAFIAKDDQGKYYLYISY